MLTSVPAAFKDSHIHAGAFQKHRQVNRNAAAAKDEHTLDRLLVGTHCLKKLSQSFWLCSDRDAVPRLEDEIAVRDADGAAALDRADEYLLLSLRGQSFKRHAVQTAALGDTESDDFEFAVRKAVHLGGRRELQNTGDLLRRDIVGVDGKAQIHNLPQGLAAVQILLVAQARDGVTRTHFAGELAGHQVCLIIARGSNEDITLANLGLTQNAGCGTASAADHGVHGVGGSFQHVGFFVDEGDIVSLPTQSPGHGKAYFSHAGDYDFHMLPPLSVKTY